MRSTPYKELMKNATSQLLDTTEFHIGSYFLEWKADLMSLDLTEAVVWRCFFRNFAKLTGKHRCHSLFFDKVAGLNLFVQTTSGGYF